MTLSFRPCTTADAGALALAAQHTFVETFSGILAPEHIAAHVLNKLSVSAFRAWLEEPDARLWLATEDGFPVGYAGLARPDLPQPTTDADTELKRIYLMAAFHGGGAASKLMQLALDEARAMGKTRVLLGVKADNARAIAFYNKTGFTQIGTRQFQVGDGVYDDVVLALTL
jgi:ribosomal protein S18 acetylase RimI-like enzyme